MLYNSLLQHKEGYQLSVGEGALMVATGFTAIPYAIRHWEMGNRIVAVIMCIPGSALFALVERIVVCIASYFASKHADPDNSKPSSGGKPPKIDYNQQRNENFYDYCIRLKMMNIPDEALPEARLITQEKKRAIQLNTPYLRALFDVINRQFSEYRRRSTGQNLSSEVVQRKVYRLMKNFLKEKMGLSSQHERSDLALRAEFDPHYHKTAMLAHKYPESRACLPNYGSCYAFFRSKDKRGIEERGLSDQGAALITEAQSFEDGDRKYRSSGKTMISLTGLQRSWTIQEHQKRKKGYDICGYEGHYQSVANIVKDVRAGQFIRIHMGETVDPDVGRANITALIDELDQLVSRGHSMPLIRIGHGTHMGIHDMMRMAQRGCYVEACLSSNKKTGVIEKRSDYPLPIMLFLGVKVVIGTDGGPLYSTTLAKEYGHAEKLIEKFLQKIREGSTAPITIADGHTPLLTTDLFPSMPRRPMTYLDLQQYYQTILHTVSVDKLVRNVQELYNICHGEREIPGAMNP